MGKAVPKAIKQKARVLLTESPDSYSDDFDKNKEEINKLEFPFFEASKINRNLVAGFITRKKAQDRKKAK